MARAPSTFVVFLLYVTHGVSVDEIKEILLQATVYCGIPTGLDAFKVAKPVLQEEGAFGYGREA